MTISEVMGDLEPLALLPATRSSLWSRDRRLATDGPGPCKYLDECQFFSGSHPSEHVESIFVRIGPVRRVMPLRKPRVAMDV
jgi:hypothetical protein